MFIESHLGHMMLMFMYSDGGPFREYRVLMFMESYFGAYRVFMFMESPIRHIGC